MLQNVVISHKCGRLYNTNSRTLATCAYLNILHEYIMLQVFLRETEKMMLDTTLHQAIMKNIIYLQRRIRSCLERKHYLKTKAAAITIQVLTSVTITMQALT